MLEHHSNFISSRQLLENAVEALKENPGCEDLRCKVLNLQNDVSRLTSDRDLEKLRFSDLSLKYAKARGLLLDSIQRRSCTKHQVITESTQTQGSGMCKLQMMHSFTVYRPLREGCFRCPIRLRKVWGMPLHHLVVLPKCRAPLQKTQLTRFNGSMARYTLPCAANAW
jgi:hypothetical protein